MYIRLVCRVCDSEGQDQRSVYCTKKQVTLLTVRVSIHYHHFLKEVVNLCWGLQIKT